MELNTESIKAFTEILEDPAAHKIPIRPLAECFEDAEVATPKHLLFKDYQTEVGDNVPKVFFYIIMDNKYPDKISKAPDGNLGYLLKFKHQGENNERSFATDPKPE